jgi:hypothetical protein
MRGCVTYIIVSVLVRKGQIHTTDASFMTYSEPYVLLVVVGRETLHDSSIISKQKEWVRVNVHTYFKKHLPQWFSKPIEP